ncbi:hypothetical protein [Devosia salina]|uniref:Uncharacterized protein n=1 Tax=Devosia salina TaxID=2860336 RepID=A0ABX8WGS9_9HYPH|nr:hypothetical protein [Devosia salina]QYO77598.1 hypothetical protein K1X15_03215 [Devosia salina]
MNSMIQPQDAEVTVVNTHLNFPKVHLIEPKASGYIHVAAEIDPIRPFGLGARSSRKREALALAKSLARRLERKAGAIRATVFVGRLLPPGSHHPQGVHKPASDLVILIETADMAAAKALQGNSIYAELIEGLKARSTYLHVVRAANGRRIGSVDFSRDGVFLFNYFHGEQPRKLIPIWEYTAGWFEDRTGLDNSELLVPEPGQGSEYGLINHCRWDHWHDILPDLALRPTFKSYVLDNFAANGVSPMPILYSLA